jgi:plastocyanin
MERGLGRLVIGGVVAALAISGCNLKGGGEDLVNGKELFVQECAACHVLKRAGATGVTGPDLDAAFKQSRADGLGESTFRGVVEQQILHPNINQQVDPKDGEKRLPLMPAKLVEGDDARDVAAYVAQAVSKEGDDPGRLAAVGASKAEGTAEAENGVLDIPVAAAGLAYRFADAKAPAGEVRVTSENPQSVPHDIAVEGNGVNEKGEVVQGGGTSEFSANLQPGEYTFFCSVPGHREGGMEGTLTVK